MLKIDQIKLPINHDSELLNKKICNLLKITDKDLLEVKILKQSIDARYKPEIFFIYSVAVKVKNEDNCLNRALNKTKNNVNISKYKEIIFSFKVSDNPPMENRPIIIGSGPAGLFCGLSLAKAGYKPIIFERGSCVEERTKEVDKFWNMGELNLDSNVQFGEGGAGTFSDGKLNTLIKDKTGLNKEVLKTFVKYGADERILYEAKPHIGTDLLKKIVKNIRTDIENYGGSVYFNSKLTDIKIENGAVREVTINNKDFYKCDCLVLALGHSARDTFELLHEKNLNIEPKSFAIGFRVVHPQKFLNISQYGEGNDEILGAAPYKVTSQTHYNRGVYSFCMCPGGYVVNASSESGRLCVNGMSYSKRDGLYGNSAIIVTITPEDYQGKTPLSGMYFQRSLEEKAYKAGNGAIPFEKFKDFENAVINGDKNYLERDTKVNTADFAKGQTKYSDLSTILPEEINKAFVEGMHLISRQIDGFDNKDTILMGLEARTSSPIRITRDEDFVSNIKGIYPCGEGAGYAGGITSAAMDGIKVAQGIALKFGI